MYIDRRAPFCIVALVLSVISTNSILQHQSASGSSILATNETSERLKLGSSQQDRRQLIVRILALFTGSSNDLGLDHRLGRQVLKLAAARARRLSPEVSDVQLLIYTDSSECKNGASGILGQVAHEFYADQAQDNAESCSSISDTQRHTSFGEGCDNQTLSRTSHLSGATGTTLSRIDAILGPSCDHLIDSVARMAAYWRTPIYTVTSISGTFGRKDVYPTLTRLSPSIDHLSMFMMTVMERFKWRHLAIVVDHGQPENLAMLANLERTIDRMRYTIPVYRKTFAFSSFAVNNTSASSPVLHGDEASELTAGLIGANDPPVPVIGQVHCSRESRELLLGVRRVARVVLLLLNDSQVVRRLLLCAHELRFNNGEYTFLALNLGLKSTSSTPGGGNSSGRQQQQQQASGKQTFDWFAEDDETNNLRARQMFESLMVFSVELPASNEYNIFVEQTLDLAQQDYPGVHFDHSSVGLLAVALHDSLLLAVEAQRRQFIGSIATNTSESSYRSLAQTTTHRNLNQSELEILDDEQQAEESNRQRNVPLLWNERYPYGLISGMHINANGDQELDYVLSDMEPELGVFRPVASYSKEARQIQMLPSSYIHWPARVNAATQQVLHNDEPPLDEPECGFTGEAQHCVDRQNLFTALGILGLFLLCLMLIAVVSLRRYRKIRYQMQLDDYWWKINWTDLEFLRAQRNSLTSNLASSLVRQLRGTDAAAAAGSIVGGLGRQSLVGSAVSSAAGQRSLASSAGSHTLKHAIGGTFGAPKAADISKRRSAVALVVTPAGGDGIHGQEKAGDGHQSQAGTSRVAKSSVFDDHSARIIHSEFSTVVRLSSLALYKGEIVIVKQLNGSSIEVSRDLLIELKGMRELSNENLARLIGLCLDPEHLSVVYEYCSRGNLQDLLLNTSISMDWNLKYSIIGDILNGLNFIHTTLLDYHGRLKSTNLVLDSRFTVKLTDFGLKSLYSQLELIENDDGDNEEEEDGAAAAAEGGDEHYEGHLGADSTGHGNDTAASDAQRRQSMAPTIYNMDSVSMRAENFTSPSRGQTNSSNFLGGTGGSGGGGGGLSNVTAGTEARMRLKNRGSARFFWTAPEHLRNRQPHLAGSKRGDVYSLAIILYEIFTRRQPYHFGTNAKPRWQVIKRDKLRHQGQQAREQQQQHQLMGGSSGVQYGEVAASCDASQVKTGSRGASFSRKRGSSQASSGTHHKPASGGAHKSSVLSRNRKRRSNASVAPLQKVESSAVDGAESCVTHSSTSSVQRAHEPAGGVPEQVTINVSAFATSGDPDTIGEELEEEAEISSIASHQQVGQDAAGSKRRMSAASCLSQELKGLGGARSRSKAAIDSEGGTKLDAEEILDQLRMGIQPEPVRPYIPNYLLQDIDARMMSLLRSCWHEQPGARPTVNSVRNTMRKITKGATAKNYLDNLLDRLQTYASQLEMIVDSKSADITAEKVRTEELLYQLVPRFVADKLKRSEPIIPQVFDGVTIFFSDIVGFEKYASVMSPCELVDLLNNIYSSFESIISSFDVTKIEVILDQFLVASGISLQQQQEHHAAANMEQPTEGAKDVAAAAAATGDGATATGDQQAQTGGGEKQKAPRSKRRILGALRGGGGSQSMDDPKRVPRGDSQESPNAQSDQATSGSGADPSHYNRSSCEQIARMALCIRDLVKSFHFRQNLNSLQQSSSAQQDDNATGLAQKPAAAGGGGGFVASNFNIRIGIHSGKVCAGIVGVKRPKFCLIGDTVNVASRMHTNSKANRIQISASTRELLKLVPGFAIEPRGRIEIKGKGMMETFWLESSY